MFFFIFLQMKTDNNKQDRKQRRREKFMKSDHKRYDDFHENKISRAKKKKYPEKYSLELDFWCNQASMKLVFRS